MTTIKDNGTCRSDFENSLRMYNDMAKFGGTDFADSMAGPSFKAGKERVQDAAKKAAAEWEAANGFGELRWVTPEMRGEYQLKVARREKDNYVSEKVLAELDAMAQEECAAKKTETAEPKIMERSFVKETPSVKLNNLSKKQGYRLPEEKQREFDSNKFQVEFFAQESEDSSDWKKFYEHRDAAMKVLTDAGAPNSEVSKWAIYFEQLRKVNHIPHHSESAA